MERAVALASAIVARVLIVTALATLVVQRIWKLAVSLADAIEWLFSKEEE